MRKSNPVPLMLALVALTTVVMHDSCVESAKRFQADFILTRLHNAAVDAEVSACIQLGYKKPYWRSDVVGKDFLYAFYCEDDKRDLHVATPPPCNTEPRSGGCCSVACETIASVSAAVSAGIK